LEEPMMTEAQPDELIALKKRPGQSGEMLTQVGAQHFIDDSKKQLAERQ
jgi:hypothetical protein